MWDAGCSIFIYPGQIYLTLSMHAVHGPGCLGVGDQLLRCWIFRRSRHAVFLQLSHKQVLIELKISWYEYIKFMYNIVSFNDTMLYINVIMAPDIMLFVA